ncbi:MAG: ABC transporter ATP-binding protein [Thermodesulfobacteriota bacterium]
MSLLETEDLSLAFDGFQAVINVDLRVEKGEIHALIGPNGAGKTTTFNLISGYHRPDKGRVIFLDHDITTMPAYKRCHLGLVRSFQRASIYPKLTVYESVLMSFLSFNHVTTKMIAPATRFMENEVLGALDDVGLSQHMDLTGESLSHGDKKRLDLAILLGANPALVMLDEPTAGMGLEETAGTMELIKTMARERGLTVLFTEHDMEVVFGIATRITVLHQGRVIGDGTPEEVKASEEVQRIYLGAAE